MNVAVPKSARRVLIALREAEALGRTQPTKTFIGWLARLAPKSGNFGNILGKMRGEGLIDYPGNNLIALTDAGRAAVAPCDPIPNDEMLSRVYGALKGRQNEMLQVIAAAYPDPISSEDIGRHMGLVHTSGNFGNIRGRLSTLGFITYPSSGMARAHDDLFPNTGRFLHG